MDLERKNRGWIAAWAVTITLTLTLLALDKFLAQSGKKGLWTLVEQTSRSISLPKPGVWLETDASLSDSGRYAPNTLSHIAWARRQADGEPVGASPLLRRPPDPASSAVLLEPLSADDFVSLPLTQGSSSIDQLMFSMDVALGSPAQLVSMSTESTVESTQEIVSTPVERMTPIRRAKENTGRIPVPTQLLSELSELRDYVGEIPSGPSVSAHESPWNGSMPRQVAVPNIQRTQMAQVHAWATQAQSLVDRLISQVGLENSESRSILDELAVLGDQGTAIGESLGDYRLASSVIRTGYSMQRRVAIWRAVQACLDDAAGQTSLNAAGNNGQNNRSQSKTAVERAIAEVESLLSTNATVNHQPSKFNLHPSERQAWREYLMLDELTRWVQNGGEDSRIANQLSRDFHSRLAWSDLTDHQRAFLQHQAIGNLASSLAAWTQNPIDYRQLLASIEQVEATPHSRLVSTVTDAIEMLARSDKPSQKELASVLNTHYRNANLRVTLSREMVERFLPQGQYEVRPVRQTILGALTYGDSEVQTKLAVRLRPDPHAWNIELGVNGEVWSNTQSSKGPATLHNTGIAQVQTQRLLRVDPNGVRISAAPTQVSSQDYLNGFNTDFDGLPLVRNFARWVVQEQINQNRGLARRITRQKIAEEADAELDRRLDESLKKIEVELQQKVLGPLQRLALNPTVISMSTTEDRLTLRYRLAHQSQLTAHTPRPRAPAAALASVQIHQSALNNTIQQIGLGGRVWTLPELYHHIGEVLQTNLAPPDDVPDDITIRFADRNPVIIELQDDRLRIHLRIAEFKRQEGLNAKNFIITSTYEPVVDGLNAGLVRDPETSVEIQGKHLSMRDRLALRVIFAKVFVSQSEIPFVAPQWREDNRAAGLVVSQLDLRNGWFAMAVSSPKEPNTDSDDQNRPHWQTAAGWQERTSAR